MTACLKIVIPPFKLLQSILRFVDTTYRDDSASWYLNDDEAISKQDIM